ncbi:MAG TPA: winged helix-turn-helix domain-containing protein [Candidatus Dormibacteraeota bacterium]|nr:winged helix-turn-helix domain-containing protein [Candidatus Dormibacteraeota bacterium]
MINFAQSLLAMPAQDTSPKLVQFGAFELDLHRGELRKQGVKVKLQGQSLKVLQILVDNPGEIISREQLRSHVWPANTFVEFDQSLYSAMARLRDALGDTSESPRFVETVARRGYRFIAPVAVPTFSTNSPNGDIRPQTELDSRAPQLVAFRRLVTSLLAGLVGGALLLAVVLVFDLLGARSWLYSRTHPIRSIAVLPLENLSGDPSQEYFADGMTEALITDLGKIGELRVISRTSAMHYKGTHKTLPEIARELNVDAVVEGAVLRSGNQVRIKARLVQAASERHLWAESYERDLRDVLALQDEVARSIANEIKIKLTPQEQARLSSGRPVDPEAHEAYLRGRYELNKWTEEGLKKSVDYFERAIQKDPAYAQAWAGLSDTYQFLSLWDSWPAGVAIPKAKAAALKAVDLDDTLSDAHVALSGVLWPHERSWSAAENEVQRAIALNPNNAWAHQSYGYQLSSVARFDEAIAEMKRALDLDPLAPNKHQSLAATLYRAGRYDEALQHFREVPDPDANSERRHRYIAAIYERKEMPKEAIAELLTALRFAGEKDLAEQVERKYVSSGYFEAKKAFLWDDIQEKQKKRARNGFGQAGSIAADYALLGEKNKAFEWLDKAFREGGISWDIKVNDRFEALRSDPRFQDLLRRMDLPP